jgi:NCS1 family nucleobase:cation symporter-1
MSVLENEDLRAVPVHARGWTTWNYAALWIGMCICIPSYTLASGYIQQGMNWWQAILTVALGNLIVLIPMLLIAHAGAKYGIPFPVFARASFGLRGANVPAMLRAVVACGWFGIQTWYGGFALAVVLEKLGIWPEVHHTAFLNDIFGFKLEQKTLDYVMENGTHLSLPTGTMGGGFLASALHVPWGDFACFLAFWVLNMAIVWAGIESIRKLLVVKSFFLPAATLALLLWAYSAAGGLGPILDRPSTFPTTSAFLRTFVLCVTGAVGFWATLSLNIPDFTRYAKSQKAQVTGQALALPTSMTAIAFVGIAVTSATALLPDFHGQMEWDPEKVVQHFSSTALVALGMFCVAVSTLATNIAANIVSPANDFSNLKPSLISFRTGGYLTGLIGILMCPWKLVEDPTGYIYTWLVGYSALLGPIAGILIADYWLVRRTALDVNDLYHFGGRYDYKRGWNAAALVALVVGILPNVPGFVFTVAPSTVAHFHDSVIVLFFEWIYRFAWIAGFLISAVVYRIGMAIQGSDAMHHGVKA